MIFIFLVLLVAGGVLLAAIAGRGLPTAVRIPAPALDEPLAAAASVASARPAHPAPESIVLAGGCFWGVQAVYEHVRGVLSATAGYAGGSAASASYETVSTGATGHAESVRVVYDPAQITLGRLLQIFFSVVHDPTELNRQGPDVGSQYRSVVFYSNPGQLRIARAYIAQLQSARVFSRPIVTALTPLTPAHAFYTAEAYHQDYARRHPLDLYIRINDLPKLADLRSTFPALAR